MGIEMSTIVKYYKPNGEFVKEYETNEPCTDLVNVFYQSDLVHFSPLQLLTKEELEQMKPSYGIDSFSVQDGYTHYEEKIVAGSVVYKRWMKLKLALVRSFRNYRDGEELKPEVLYQYFWLSFFIGELIAYLAIAKKSSYLVEIVFIEG